MTFELTRTLLQIWQGFQEQPRLSVAEIFAVQYGSASGYKPAHDASLVRATMRRLIRQVGTAAVFEAEYSGNVISGYRLVSVADPDARLRCRDHFERRSYYPPRLERAWLPGVISPALFLEVQDRVQKARAS